ncbi:hypothetical protein GGD56_004472 [Rhizobium mongolense]|uniref:Transposase n=1 Tax=Rhizobium mongolense TaxID=57676 RepID=A0ABR6IRT5_9HYPH|nr:hypothetical protein [Rhizobium mongolense]
MDSGILVERVKPKAQMSMPRIQKVFRKYYGPR